MVHCIMLAMLNDEFSHKFENALSEEMIQVLNDFFGTLNDMDRHKTSCAIFNARMKEGSSVTDHVLNMIELMEHLSSLGFLLHEQLRKDAILNSLSKSFLPFLTNYRLSKPVVNYHGLLGLLQTFKKDHQLHKKMVNFIRGSSSEGHRPLGKRNKKKKNKKV